MQMRRTAIFTVTGLVAITIAAFPGGCDTPSPSAVGERTAGEGLQWTPIRSPLRQPEERAAARTDVGSRAPSGGAGAPAAPGEPRAPTTSGVTVTRDPWTFGDAPGLVLRSPHYEMNTTLRDEGLLRDLPVLMEGALDQYRSALAELPPPRRMMRSMVFERRSEWATYTKRRLPQEADTYLGIGRGGYTTGGESVLYNLGRSDTFTIAVHEGWHQYTQSTFEDRLPTWLEEGVACWMEGHRFRRQALPTFAPWRNMERYGALRDAVREGRMVALEDLLRGTPQEALGSGRATLLGYYAQVWALVHFLNEGEGGRYREGLRRILVDAAQGNLVRTLMASDAVPREAKRPWVLTRGGRWAALAYFNPDLEELETEFRAFVERIVGSGSAGRIWRGESPLAEP